MNKMYQCINRNTRLNNNKLITYYLPECYLLKNTTITSEYYLQYLHDVMYEWSLRWKHAIVMVSPRLPRCSKWKIKVCYWVKNTFEMLISVPFIDITKSWLSCQKDILKISTKTIQFSFTFSQLSRCSTARGSSSGLSLRVPTKVTAFKSFLFNEVLPGRYHTKRGSFLVVSFGYD